MKPKYWTIGAVAEEEGLIPEYVQQRQDAYNRALAAEHMRETLGMTYREMGEAIGVSAARARELCGRASRLRRENRLSPIEHWIKYGSSSQLDPNGDRALANSIARRAWHKRVNIEKRRRKLRTEELMLKLQQELR